MMYYEQASWHAGQPAVNVNSTVMFLLKTLASKVTTRLSFSHWYGAILLVMLRILHDFNVYSRLPMCTAAADLSALAA